MNIGRQLLYSVLILIIISGLIGYFVFLRYNLLISSEDAVERARQTVKLPDEAIFLGTKLLNISAEQRYVVSWKIVYEAYWPLQGMLIEIQVSKKGDVLNVLNYPLPAEEFYANISKILAYKIAEDVFLANTNASSSHDLAIPKVEYQGINWEISWIRRVGNFIVSGAQFIVRIDSNTGEVKQIDNFLDRVPSLEAPDAISVLRERAIEIAELHIKTQAETGYAAKNVTVMAMETVLEMVEYPRDSSSYRPAWGVALRGYWLVHGDYLPLAASVTIDAQTGEILSSVFAV